MKSNKLTTDIDIVIGKNIKIFRVTRKISRSKLAEQLFITHQQLQKYEMGVNRIPASRLFVVAEILNIPIVSFFNDNGDNLNHISYHLESNDFYNDFLKIDNLDLKNAVSLVIKSLVSNNILNK